jgi:hypothetical protein
VIEAIEARRNGKDFRTSYSAARLFALLVDELDAIAPGYVHDFRNRLSYGIAVGYGFLEEDPESDGPALIPGADGETTMMDLSAAELLEEQLFPENEHHDPRDFHQVTRGMAVVALHSALEAYADAIGVTKPRSPLPKAIVGFLSAHGGMPSGLVDELTELDETRHLVVHHRGVVSSRYTNNVKYNKGTEGELRSMSAGEVRRYADNVWGAAEAVRSAQKHKSS